MVSFETAATGTLQDGGRLAYLDSGFVSLYFEIGEGFALIFGGARSSDGLSWDADPSLTFLPTYDEGLTTLIGSANGKLFFGSNGNRLIYTSNGINWTVTTLPGDISDKSISYFAGLWIVTGRYTNTFHTSPDLVTWTARSMPAMPVKNKPAAGMSAMLVVSTKDGIETATTVNRSTDGASFTQTSLPANVVWSPPANGNGVWVLPESTGRIFRSSDDGLSWSEVLPKPTATQNYEVNFFNGFFVLTTPGTGDTRLAYYSADGLAWTQIEMPKVTVAVRAPVAIGPTAMVVGLGGEAFVETYTSAPPPPPVPVPFWKSFVKSNEILE